MPRVALYARFSSDLQRQTSIADQLRAARDRAAKEGWHIVAEHADEQVSGSVPFALRPGSKALLADALAKRFDILIIEGLDRAFRDLGEQEQIVKRIEHRGLRIIGTSDGYDTIYKGRKVTRVVRGLVNELYLDDLGEKTHRGLTGQFSRGLSAGGRSYGYRTEAVDGGRRVVIDPAEADNVRWIFEQAAAGRSTRTIAYELNARGVPSPRGGTWALSALGGSMARGLGLLQNEMYVGRVIWNRRQWLKDPETGRRRYVSRPEIEWQRRDAPELRIVSDDLWAAAARARRPNHNVRGGGRATLFGGLLRCAACGGAVVAVNAKRYACGAHKDRGPTVCPSEHTWSRVQVDRRLVSEVRTELLRPAALRQLREGVKDRLAAAARQAPEQRPRRAALQAEVERLVDAVAQTGYSPALAARLHAAEAALEQAARAEERQAVTAAGAAEMVEQAVAAYRAMMMQLEQALAEDEDREQTRRLLAGVLGRVTLLREEGENFAVLEDPAERLMMAVGGIDSSGCEGAQLRQSTRRIKL